MRTHAKLIAIRESIGEIGKVDPICFVERFRQFRCLKGFEASEDGSRHAKMENGGRSRKGDESVSESDLRVVGRSVGGGSASREAASATTSSGRTESPSEEQGFTFSSGAGLTARAPQRRLAARRTRPSRRSPRGNVTNLSMRAAAEARRNRIFGSEVSGDDDSSEEEEEVESTGDEPVFRVSNRFSGLNPDEVLGRSAAVRSLLESELSRSPGYLSGPISMLSDSGETLWGQGDESDETMQRILERSYFDSRTRELQRTSEDSEDAMLQKALQESLKFNELSRDEHAVANEGTSDLDAVETQSLEKALKLSVKAQEESAKIDEELADVQIASLVESQPEEIVAQTLALWHEMKNDFERNGGTVPSVQDALAKAEQAVKRKKDAEEELEMINLHFAEFEEDYAPEVMQEAKLIHTELRKKQVSSGGRAPTVEYALSLASDRAKDRRREHAEAKAEKEQQVKEAERAEAEELQEKRQKESRQERAARFAAAFEKRKTSEQSD